MPWSIAVCYAVAVWIGWPVAAAVGLLAAVRPRARRLRLGIAVPCLLATALGAGDGKPAPVPSTNACSGWIASRPERAGSRWRAVFVTEDRRPVRFVLWSRVPLPSYGTRVSMQGASRGPRAARHFHARGEAPSLAAAGAAGFFEVERYEILAGGAGSTLRRTLLEPWRSAIAQRFDAHLADREAGLLAALVVGIRDDVDERTQDAWRALGLAHILSISGMHVALIAGFLLAWLGAPRTPARALPLVAGIWIYAGLGGFGPTVLRAALMATWAALALLLGRSPRGITGLGIAVLTLTLLASERRDDLGFQLSCLATAGLVVWAGPLLRLRQRCAQRGRCGAWLGFLVVSCGAGLAAQLATLPLQLAHFGMVSWAAPLLNLIAVPLTDAALGLGLLALPLLGLAADWGGALLLAAGGLLHVALRITDAAHAWWGGCVWVPVDAVSITAATVVAGIVLAMPAIAGSRRWGRTWPVAVAMAAATCAVLVLRAIWPSVPSWQLEALDVGQGDALLLRIRTGAWLVDAGSDRPVDCGARVIVPHLRRAGVRRLRGLLLSHPHADHIGGAPSVLAAIPVDTIYVAAISRHERAYSQLAAAFPHVPVRGLGPGSRMALGAHAEARILWPDSTAGSTNDASLVMRVHGDGIPEVIFAGDLEREGEAALLATTRTPLVGAGFVILKVGHHGSDTSSTPALLAGVRPDVALISVGIRNRYGHPSPAILARFDSLRCPVLRTDEGGAIRMVLRGSTLWVERPAAPARIAGSLRAPG
jgi:competence protein ComEC